MSQTKLFKISGQKAVEIGSTNIGLEKSLQSVIEKNLDSLLGIKFLCSEYGTGKAHGGRIDTLGLDEDGCPVIIEYKRAINENVINQGLFYLDWLLDHKAEFKFLVLEKFGKASSEKIIWSSPRLVCIASDFTKYDEHAVKQINRNIDLVRYRKFGNDLLAFDLAGQTTADDTPDPKKHGNPLGSGRKADKPIEDQIKELDQPMRDLYESLRAFILGLGDDVTEKPLKLYVAFRRMKTFASIIIQKKQLLINVPLDPDQIVLEEGFTRDVRKIGHWASGDLVITVKTQEQLAKARPLISRSYEEA
jgi:predicted transport protein